MNEYLFVFTIGPVKDFISQSRKTQDLFAGSALLSHLTGEAIKYAITLFAQGKDIIITPWPETKFKPNRFVAKINQKESLDLKEIGLEIEKEVRAAFSKIANIPFTNGFNKPLGFDEQLQDYLEINWLFCPIKDNNYKSTYHRLFQELASIKNIVPFTKFEETGRKCSVDGKYNIKIYRNNIKFINQTKIEYTLGNYNLNGNTKYSKLHQETTNVSVLECNNINPLKIWHLQEGEGISAISLTKRIFNPEELNKLSQPHKFKSTAYISLMNWIDQVKDYDEYKTYENKVISGSYLSGHSDDQLFYKDNIEQIVNKIDDSKTQYVLSLHKALTDRIEKEKILEPFTKYYALIRFDGDNMGDWLLGNNLKEGEELEQFHRKFTICVDGFAKEIDKYLDEPRGKVIYAGGEDFMAMVNIHHLFDVIDKIRLFYKTEINDNLINFKKTDSPDLTISLGIAIAHYKQPLPMVLDKAKEMEDLAKNYDKNKGKNSFAIGVMKHSGNALESVMPFSKSHQQILPIINTVFESIENKDFSTTFLRNIYDSFENYGFDMPLELVKSKIKLYVPRSANNVTVDTLKMISDVTQLLELMNNKHFGDLLLILDFLNRKTVS